MIEPERLERSRILVVGDSMLDRYWFGTVDRISPEAPVPIVRVLEIEERPGGAANVAMNVAALGASCVVVGVVGDDKEAISLRGLLTENSVSAMFAVDKGRRTVTKLRIVSQNQQLIRADFDDTPSDQAISEHMDLYKDALDSADVVVISDYGKGGLRNVEAMIKAANEQAVPVLVDPKGTDFSRYADSTIVTPNIKEFEAIVGPVGNDEELRTKALELIRELRVHGLLITRGERGMVLVEKEAQWFDYPASAKEVFDVSGAGDTVIASLAVGYALKLPDESLVKLANAAAGIVVGKVGTATATVEEVLQVLDGQRGQRGTL